MSEAERTAEAGAGQVNAARLRTAVGRLSRRLRSTAAAFAGLTPTMLSRLVPKLEQAGLIRRLPDGADRRVCRVEATGKGHRLLERVRSERNDALSRRLAELDSSQREALAAAVPVLEELAELLLRPAPTDANGTKR